MLVSRHEAVTNHPSLTAADHFTVEDLSSHFSKYGPVKRANVIFVSLLPYASWLGIFFV